MPIDPNIISGLRPFEVESPISQFAKINQLRNMQQESQFNQLRMQEAQSKLDEYQRGLREQETLRNLLTSPDFNIKNPTHVSNMLAIAPTAGATYLKTIGEAQERLAKTEKEQEETLKARQDRAMQAANKSAQLWGIVKTPNDLKIALDTAVKSGTLPQEQADAALLEVNNHLTGGGNFADFAKRKQMSALSTIDQVNLTKPNYQWQDLGNRKVLIDVNANSPTFKKTASEMPIGTSPDTLARIAEQRREFDISQTKPTAQELKQQQTDKKTAEGKELLNKTLTKLKSEYTNLKNAGGMITEEKGTLGNVLTSGQASWLGQEVGRATGSENQKRRDVINSLNKQLSLAIKNATGMTGGELNSKFELDSLMKSLGNPSLSYEATSSILDNLNDLFLKGGADLKIQKKEGSSKSSTLPASSTPSKPSVTNW